VKVLVTGTAGFIGAEVALQLLARGDEVVGYDNVNDYYSVDLKYARLARLGIKRSDCIDNSMVQGSPGFRFVKANLEDTAFMMNLFAKEKFDRVVHLAAQAGVRYSIENPMAYIQSNVVGFMNVLEACRKYPVEHLVYASSSSVYGANAKIPFSTEDRVDNPVSLYAATKKSNELMAHSYSHLYKIPTTGLRFFTVYGPWGRPDMAPMLFAKAIMEGRPIKVFNNGNMKRDFTYIDDIVVGVISVIDIPPHINSRRVLEQAECPFYKIYNIGRGEPVDLMEFIEILEKELGRNADKVMLGMQDGDVPVTWANTSEFNNDFSIGFEFEIGSGVHSLIEWLLGQSRCQTEIQNNV